MTFCTYDIETWCTRIISFKKLYVLNAALGFTDRVKRDEVRLFRLLKIW
jgi:hypothetical protein